MNIEHSQLSKDINECQKCDISKCITQKVINKGTYNTSIMFVGEA